jgi:hypothetical protein
VRPLCGENTLPHEMQIKDCVVEGEKFALECPLEIDRGEALITCPNAVYSAYPKRTWTLA